MSINRKPIPMGPPPPYYENGLNETHPRHDDYGFAQEQQQQQPLREDGRQRRWDGEMWRQPLSQLENWSQSQLENWNQRQAANNNRPVPVAFTELPENQPFPQRPVPVPAQNPQSFPNSPNGSSGSFPQQPTGEPSYRYLSFPKSPAQNKFSPTTDHHQPSPITEQYHYASSEARSPSLQPPSRDHAVTQQQPATHQSSTPPLTESRIRDSDSSVSTQFKVQRKPLRSYKSSPAVNTLAQQGGAVSADTQRAWDVQAEKLIRNNTFNVTPLPQRVPVGSQGTQQFHSHNQPYHAQELERPDLSVKTSIPSRMMDSNPYLSPSTAGGSNLSVSAPNTRPSTASSSVNFGASTNSLSTTITSTDATITETSSTTKTKFNPGAAVQDAFREARHFAGGLIHHPATSTKHFSILRHSHGLVFYQGPNTSLTISLFASEPMPETRRIYLQPKGWSGGTGMRIKQFVGATKHWLDVTPNLCISAEQLNPRDERAWQRDIKSFNKRREKTKKIQKHLLRETTVIRIPSDAGDGYFQLILCLDGVKQKVLCTSPTFRLLSLSTSPSSMRGASLSTIPMEMGIKAVEIYAAKVAGPAAMLAQSKILSKASKASEKFGVLNKASKVQEKVEKVGKHVPKGFLEKAAEMVEGASGADDAKPKDGAYLLLGGEDISLTHGPLPPYPIHLTGQSSTAFHLPPPSPSSDDDELLPPPLPLITLTHTPSTPTTELYGHYFGWTRYLPSKHQLGTIDDDWHCSVISILPPTATQLQRADFKSANKKVVTLRIVDEVDTDLPTGVKVEVYVMGILAADEALVGSETNTPTVLTSSDSFPFYGDEKAGVGGGKGKGEGGEIDSFSELSLNTPSTNPSTHAPPPSLNPSHPSYFPPPPSSNPSTPPSPSEDPHPPSSLSIIQAILDNPSWSPEAAESYRNADTVNGIKDGVKKAASIQGVVGAKAMVKDGMGRVPLHRLGVRGVGDGGERGGGMVVNGFWVVR